MKFSLISDMHINHPQEKTPYDKLEEVVVVAGDTDNGLGGLKFLNKLRRKGHTVFATYGNHEHYANATSGRFHHETSARFREDFPAQGEIEPGLPIALRCGWYVVKDEPLWQGYMNDSRMCRMGAGDVNRAMYDDAFYLRQQLAEWKDYNYRGVVVTHMAPCEESLNKEFEGHFSNDWYWSPEMRKVLTEYKDQILVWCHGHTHAAADVVVDGVRVVANPRGYPGENPAWAPLTIEV